MSRQVRSINHRIRFVSASVLPLCLLLTACGGAGTEGVASTPPPPPTPAPPPVSQATSIDVQTSWLNSPATRVGSYDTIALATQTANGTSSFRFAAPGEFRLDVTQSAAGSGFVYSLTAPSGFLPGGLSAITVPIRAISWDFNPGGPNYRYGHPYGDYPQFFGQNLKEYDVYSDGTKKLQEDYDYSRESYRNAIVDISSTERISESVEYDLGLSYVAMGEWSWGPVTTNSNGTSTPTGDSKSVYFVYGDRTAGSAIPASGTAIYDAHSLALRSNGGAAGIPFTLTADFGQRTMSTQIDQNYRYDAANPSSDPILGLHVSGSAPFSNSGDFNIPLAGTANYSATNSPMTPPSEAVAGSMNGAFFGPHAEQVGGTFAIQRTDGTLLMQDAFVGHQP